MELGNFFCETCGEELDESAIISKAITECPVCSGVIWSRRSNVLLKGSRVSVPHSIQDMHEQSQWRKQKGDEARREQGLDRLNVKKNIH